MSRMLLAAGVVVTLALLLAAAAPARADLAWRADGGWEKTGPPSAGEGSAQFDRAFELFANREYSKASGILKDVVKTAPEPLREEAAIMRAESLLAERDYRKAFAAYENFIKEYPNSRYLNRALEGELQIARRLLAGARMKVLGLRIWSAYTTGEKIVDKIISKRPFSDYARKAQIALARSYYRRELYIESASAYRQYVEFYPNGGEVQEALLGMGRSLVNDAQGPNYDPVPYYRAQAVAKEFLGQYPYSSDAPATRNLERRAADKLAEHYFLVAKWYLKKGRTESAALYLEKIRRSWPDTEWAERSATIMETLRRSEEESDAS